MALWIHNVSDPGTPDSEPQSYNLNLNNKTLCSFKHVRDQGAAECLREAARALEQHQAVVASRYNK